MTRRLVRAWFAVCLLPLAMGAATPTYSRVAFDAFARKAPGVLTLAGKPVSFKAGMGPGHYNYVLKEAPRKGYDCFLLVKADERYPTRSYLYGYFRHESPASARWLALRKDKDAVNAAGGVTIRGRVWFVGSNYPYPVGVIVDAVLTDDDLKAETPAKPTKPKAADIDALLAPLVAVAGKPLTEQDVVKVIGIWGAVNKSGGMPALRKPSGRIPSIDAVVKEAEANAAVKAAITGGGMGVREFVEKATITQLSAKLIRRGGVQRMESQVTALDAKLKAMKAPATQPEAADAQGGAVNTRMLAMLREMAPLLKGLLKVAKAIPPQTLAAVGPHVAEVIQVSRHR